MSLFRKKYNKEKDYLTKRFNPNDFQFYYTKLINGEETVIPYNDLDGKTKKELLYDNRMLLTNKEYLNQEIEKYNTMQRYKYLNSIGYSCDSFEYLGKVDGTVSSDMKMYLDSLLNEPNTLVGIHRVGANFNDKFLDDVFQKGLIMTGHMGGAVQSPKQLKENVSYYPSNKVIEKELMYADSYKNSKGSILISIPDNVLENGTDMFISDGVNVRLNTKYIVGYVPVYQNHHIENIISNSNFYKNEKESNKSM